MTSLSTGPAADLAARRMLLVHAHPDDESIGQGVTMAKYAAEGAHVTLVTCTRGEEGEVLVPDLAHLASDRDDTLGERRVDELAAAMKELGVEDHRFLGGAGRYRDTGMAWGDNRAAAVPEIVREDTFWRADLREAADLLVEIIREVRPQVLITYDQFGGYGHPDHVQAHRVATYGAALAAVASYRTDLGESWDIPKIYWSAVSESRMREGIRRMRAAGDTTSFEGWDPDGELPPFVTPDELISTVIDGREYLDRKMAAMRAHATQIPDDSPFFSMTEQVGAEAFGVEFFRTAKGTPVRVAGEHETDLFAGTV